VWGGAIFRGGAWRAEICDGRACHRPRQRPMPVVPAGREPGGGGPRFATVGAAAKMNAGAGIFGTACYTFFARFQDLLFSGTFQEDLCGFRICEDARRFKRLCHPGDVLGAAGDFLTACKREKGPACRVVDGRHVSRGFVRFVGLRDVVTFQEDLLGATHARAHTQGHVGWLSWGPSL